ncbi:hypothetical protein [Pseudogemmobacter sp. W21_MBD1_M6]|uniref:hypothetical protein n=1 Tax=Pseudogemmobacter sp. W21_MBD1_M6 TaxID=3240271 RepID=UPI003F9DE8A2
MERPVADPGANTPLFPIRPMMNGPWYSPERVAGSFSEWLDLCTRCGADCAADFAKTGIKAGKGALQAAPKTKHATRV